LEQRSSKSKNSGLLKSNKVVPLSSSSRDGSRSPEDDRVKNASSTTPTFGSARACCSDSTIDTLKTGNDKVDFAERENRGKDLNHINYLALTPSALKNLTSKRNDQPFAMQNRCIITKQELLKDNGACCQLKCKNETVRYLTKSCQQPSNFHHQYHKKHQMLLQSNNNENIKQQTQQQHLQQSEDSTCVLSEREKKEIRKVNYVTFMMFTITATYVLTWVTTWVMYAIFDQTTVTGRVILYLTKTSFVVNYIANPIFFTFMSARFRERAKNLIFCRK
jgi:hypothetical protein